MPHDLKAAHHPLKTGLERGAYRFCNHRRWVIQPVRIRSDHFGRKAGAEQTPGSVAALNSHHRTVCRLAMGAAFEVFQPGTGAGLELTAGQKVRSSSDFADVITLGGGRVALVLGDAGGKGQVAVRCVPQALSVLRLILSECTHPDCALSQLNRYLCDLGQSAAYPVMALSLAVVDVRAGEAICACAGSEPPLILRASGSLEAVNSGSVALGVDAERKFRAVEFLFGMGDALLMATDGITKAVRANGDETQDVLCYEGMAGLALTAFRAGGPPGRMAREVLDGARAFAGGAFPDDASVLVAIHQ